MINSTLGAFLGGTTRGAHHAFDCKALSWITPPNLGSGAGNCLPLMVVVAPGEPGVPVACTALPDPPDEWLESEAPPAARSAAAANAMTLPSTEFWSVFMCVLLLFSDSAFSEPSALNLLFGPFPRRVQILHIEVLDFRQRERLAHRRHPLLPILVADQGYSLDILAMFCCEFCVVPDGLEIPAVEILEVGQYPDLTLGFDGRLDDRNKMLVVFVVQFAAELETKNSAGSSFQWCDHKLSSLKTSC